MIKAQLHPLPSCTDCEWPGTLMHKQLTTRDGQSTASPLPSCSDCKWPHALTHRQLTTRDGQSTASPLPSCDCEWPHALMHKQLTTRDGQNGFTPYLPIQTVLRLLWWAEMVSASFHKFNKPQKCIWLPRPMCLLSLAVKH